MSTLADTISAGILCLASVIHGEARGEPTAGKIAVAHVVLHRVEHHEFPGTICEVVSQPKQFAGYRRYSKRTLQTSGALRIAKAAVAGRTKDHTKGALFFKTKEAKFSKTLRAKIKYTTSIGNHEFYKIK